MGLLLYAPAYAQAPLAPQKEKGTVDVKELAHQIAQDYGINEKDFTAVIQCESNWDIRADGDKHTSFGLLQIHLPAHPEVSYIDATDPVFALKWGAQAFKEGKQGMWSCWRIVKG